MILGSHNSWSYLPIKQWWLKPFSFIGRCQNLSIEKQYNKGVRCFDLRVRFNKSKIKVCHGYFQYDTDRDELYYDLEWLNSKKDVLVRVIHEVRNKKQYTNYSFISFNNFCNYISVKYQNIRFWCGRNVYNWNIDYKFTFEPSCEEKYSSVCKPKIIDDWWPWLFAKLNNKRILEEKTDKDILLIDFIN